MMPQAGDEVLVAFEHGDVQPPVRARLALERQRRSPDDLVQTDGSFALHTDQQIAMQPTRRSPITGKDTLKLESSGDMTINDATARSSRTPIGRASISGRTIKIEANSTLTIKGTSISDRGPDRSRSSGMVQLG